MKNIIKGYITSIIGLIIMITDGLYFFGVIDLPSPDYTPKSIELGIAFIVGLGLFLIPATKLEEKIEKIIDNKINADNN